MIVDARGHRCPVPSLKLQKALQTAAPGAHVILLATDPMARIDVPFLMAQIGGEVVAIDDTEGGLSITVSAPDGPKA